MKRIITIALFALASLFTAATANAQSHRVRVTIPFNFNADGVPMAAGTYTIASEDLVSVVIQNGKQNVFLLSKAPAEDKQSEYSKLVFNRYGDQYFLSKILCPYAHMNLDLPLSKKEKKVRLAEASLHQNDQTSIVFGR